MIMGASNMSIILSVDGGGSKINAILFDDKFRLLGAGKSGGVNTNSTTLEDCRNNVADCLNQVFRERPPAAIDRLYAVFVGPINVLFEEVEKLTTVKEKIRLNEARAGLLAGALKKNGILAIAGTGSDIFYIREDREKNEVVGAWGPILGDQGSGTWIGQKALRAVVAGIEGWGEPTMIREIIHREWKLKNDWDMVNIIHKSPAPFRKAASVTPMVGEAAAANDPVAIRILKEAGTILAVQTDCLIRREKIPEEYLDVVCCGGAWKSHPIMFDTFKARLKEKYPAITVVKPWFEHVLAGPAQEMLNRQIPAGRVKNTLEKCFPEYVIKW
jgi:N-acetylglucosamine kinase-like BadF-type ATPase